ncbi:hypothetical protein M3P05_05350 [Sansalvadorimonas sp. 2012CJ34-2]|uniref:Uncharacterized protein n=1 Tax=Parendozoicomonas callyspongiae TaxID=2942213 RepID=A0ABT0PDS5_9GAMM|nr:hypothetical protein [Sansalvadorimonas sp. 2012CJ34-2]MCL6269371.1 hypothetical protein [Sansalvadorimonas sp. 2012CJ34-2]
MLSNTSFSGRGFSFPAVSRSHPVSQLSDTVKCLVPVSPTFFPTSGLDQANSLAERKTVQAPQSMGFSTDLEELEEGELQDSDDEDEKSSVASEDSQSLSGSDSGFYSTSSESSDDSENLSPIVVNAAPNDVLPEEQKERSLELQIDFLERELSQALRMNDRSKAEAAIALAEEKYKKSGLENKPVRIHLMRVRIMQFDEQHQEALTILDRLPGTPEKLCSQGFSLLALEHCNEAWNVFNKSLEISEESKLQNAKNCRHGLIKVALKQLTQEKCREALIHCMTMKLDEDSDFILRLEIRLLLAFKNLDEVIKHLSCGSSRNKEILIHELFARKEYMAALKLLNLNQGSPSGQAEVYFQQALIQFNQGKKEINLCSDPKDQWCRFWLIMDTAKTACINSNQAFPTAKNCSLLGHIYGFLAQLTDDGSERATYRTLRKQAYDLALNLDPSRAEKPKDQEWRQDEWSALNHLKRSCSPYHAPAQHRGQFWSKYLSGDRSGGLRKMKGSRR